MLLSSACEEKLIDWLSIPSWNSGNRSDFQRRKNFIAQYYIDHGELLDHNELFVRMANIVRADISIQSSTSEMLENELENIAKKLKFYAHNGKDGK